MLAQKMISNETNVPKLRLIKSKERVRDAGEVFTPDFLVEQMLDLFPEDAWGKEKNWLEPTCGNGQFIVGVLNRKIKKGTGLLQALNTTFGMDIMRDNVSECRTRILNEVVIPNLKKSRRSKEDKEKLICTAICIIANNIVHTEDSLLEDWNHKFRYFDDQPMEKKRAAFDRARRLYHQHEYLSR